MIDEQRCLEVFRALGEPVRLEIFTSIASVAELPCVEPQQRVGLAKSTISYHIKILARAGLIRVRKQGRNFYYAANRDVLQALLLGFVGRVGAA